MYVARCNSSTHKAIESVSAGVPSVHTVAVNVHLLLVRLFACIRRVTDPSLHIAAPHMEQGFQVLTGNNFAFSCVINKILPAASYVFPGATRSCLLNIVSKVLLLNCHLAAILKSPLEGWLYDN
jgi:hypothetical protein